MASDTYTLAEARANINDETCRKNGWEVLDGYPPWCSTHDQPFLPDDPFCVTAPAELVAVAAQLLATVERVTEMCRDTGNSSTGPTYVMCADVLAAINGADR